MNKDENDENARPRTPTPTGKNVRGDVDAPCSPGLRRQGEHLVFAGGKHIDKITNQ